MNDMTRDEKMADKALDLILSDHSCDKYTSDLVTKKLKRARDGEDDAEWWSWKVWAITQLLRGAITQNLRKRRTTGARRNKRMKHSIRKRRSA